VWPSARPSSTHPQQTSPHDVGPVPLLVILIWHMFVQPLARNIA
jgi:hypothetical protein